MTIVCSRTSCTSPATCHPHIAFYPLGYIRTKYLIPSIVCVMELPLCDTCIEHMISNPQEYLNSQSNAAEFYHNMGLPIPDMVNVEIQRVGVIDTDEVVGLLGLT